MSFSDDMENKAKKYNKLSRCAIILFSVLSILSVPTFYNLDNNFGPPDYRYSLSNHNPESSHYDSIEMSGEDIDDGRRYSFIIAGVDHDSQEYPWSGDIDKELKDILVVSSQKRNVGTRRTRVTQYFTRKIHVPVQLSTTTLQPDTGTDSENICEYKSDCNNESVWTGEPLKEKYQQYGAQGLIDSIKNLTGVEPQGYIEFDYPNIVETIDALGGIDVSFTGPIVDKNGKELFSGAEKNFNGKEVLQILRNKDTETTDIEKIKSQQDQTRRIFNAAIEKYDNNKKSLDNVEETLENSMLAYTPQTISYLGFLKILNNDDPNKEVERIYPIDKEINDNSVSGDISEMYYLFNSLDKDMVQ